jgi:Permeases of the drug/metabolite transporter (DMT) superfamily
MRKGYTYIILSAIIFSTMEIAGKIVSKQINPFELNLLRFLIGAVVLLPLAIKDLRKRKISLNKNDVGYFFVTGFLCVFVSMSFFQLAIVYAKASTVAIVFSTNPVFTIPFAYLILREQLNKNTILSLGISLLGLIFILNPFSIDSDIKGIVLAILAAVVFSLYSVIGKMRSNRYGSIVMNCFTFLAGDFIMLSFMFISQIPYLVKLNEKIGLSMLSNIPIIYGVNKGNIITLMYLGIVVTGLGYLFYFLAMEETSATTASIVFFIKPALAPILSLIILHESITTNTMLGILCILMGSYITFIGRSSRNNTEITEIKNLKV